MGKKGGYDQTALSSRLKAMVGNKIDLMKVSALLKVNPSTIQKIVEGRPVSRSISTKIKMALRQNAPPEDQGPGSPESNRSTIERLMKVYFLYKKERSLRTVGKKLGLSRERVRQLLEKGSEIGLFEYNPTKLPLL